MNKNGNFRRIGLIYKAKALDELGAMRRESTEEKKFGENQLFLCIDKNMVFEDEGYEPNIYFDAEKFEFVSGDDKLVKKYERKLNGISAKFLDSSESNLLDMFVSK